MSNDPRRVVVTGMGVVSPLGCDIDRFWSRLIAGQSGVGLIHNFDASSLPVRIAAEVRDFDPLEYMDRRTQRRMDPFAQYALAAAILAHDDSQLDVSKEPDRVGAVVATGVGGLGTFEDQLRTLWTKGNDRMSPLFIPMMIPNMAAAQISLALGTKGPLSTVCTACAASTNGIGDAFEIIRRGAADAMFAGGSEAPVCNVGLTAFAAMRALSTRNDEPEKASRPFDRDRDGFVMGEGAGIMVLEELEPRRGARGHHLRRARRLRHELRRLPPHAARRDRRDPGARHAHGHRRGRHRPVRDRLHQRPRHLHAARRRRRDAGDQARPGRGERPQGRDLLDQVDDRSLPGRLRRSRGDHLGADHRPRRHPADHQPDRSRPRVRPRLRAATRRGRRRSTWRPPTRSGSAATTRRSSFGATADDRHGRDRPARRAGRRSGAGSARKCRADHDPAAVKENLSVCPACGYHQRIGARERIAQLADDGTFVEYWGHLRTLDPLDFVDLEPYPERVREAQGVEPADRGDRGRHGHDRRRRPACWPSWTSASWAAAWAASWARSSGARPPSAADEGRPLVAVASSGGARMQEGALSLMQMAKTTCAVDVVNDARVPFVAVMADPVHRRRRGELRQPGRHLRGRTRRPAVLLGSAGDLADHARAAPGRLRQRRAQPRPRPPRRDRAPAGAQGQGGQLPPSAEGRWST